MTSPDDKAESPATQAYRRFWRKQGLWSITLFRRGGFLIELRNELWWGPHEFSVDGPEWRLRHRSFGIGPLLIWRPFVVMKIVKTEEE
jgi:hypothetical protein